MEVKITPQAFPMPLAHEYGYEGMDLRDYFAAKALAAILGLGAGEVEMDCEMAYVYADEMIKQGNK